MGSLLRSKHMSLIQIIERNDAAYQVVGALGELGVVQLRDMNAGTAFYKRTFSEQLKRCDELSRWLGSLRKQIAAVGLAPLPRDESIPLSSVRDLVDELRDLEVEVATMRSQELHLLHSHNALTEHLHVLRLAADVYDDEVARELQARLEVEGADRPPGPPLASTPSVDREDAAAPPLQESIELGAIAPLVTRDFGTGAGSADTRSLCAVAGTIPRELMPLFERTVYRMSRGNIVVQSTTIDEPLLTGEAREARRVPKNAFIVFFSGTVLQTKLLKVCTHLGARVYQCADSAGARAAAEGRLSAQLAEMSDVMGRTTAQRRSVLEGVAEGWAYWRHVCDVERSTLHALNLLAFDIKRHVFVAEGWVPTDEVGTVRAALAELAEASRAATRPIVNVLRTSETPPTYLPTNKFTRGFQALVDTYGVPRYREVNPGAFAIVLFPFLFGIMFGDVGHGSLLLLLALYLIANESTLSKARLDDIMGMTFGGRYILLLNALFAIYVGFVYNEAFAVPLGLFESRWSLAAPGDDAVVWDGTAYPFGVDPAWHRSSRKMEFFNSYKMKVSIVFGVAQMSLGIMLSLLNHVEFADRRSIWFQFVPEMVFFLSIFGYLVYLIFAKWATDWVGEAREAPSLLNVLIGMFMSPGSYTEPSELVPGQARLQLWLLLAAFAAVPCMLIPKPLLVALDRGMLCASRYRGIGAQPASGAHESRPLRAADEGDVELAARGEGGGEGEGEEEEDGEEGFGDIVVHQVIHTIEFVLGSISNTASYLRLWALSLAHSQLSELFWEKVMRQQAFGAAAGGSPAPVAGVTIFFAFATWLMLTLGVLMVMENLSSFLHALRLQWVEFQNKFYHGDGQKFAPFSYAAIGEDGE